MKIIIYVALFVVVFVTPQLSFAEESNRNKLAGELLVVMQMEKRFGGMQEQMQRLAEGQINSLGIAATEKEKMIQIKQITNNILFSEFSWAAMKGEFTNIYAETYTEEELKGIISFFKSSAGQAYVRKANELNVRLMEMSQNHAMQILPKIEKAVAEFKKKNNL